MNYAAGDMSNARRAVVTGAFSYTGAAIARSLLARGFSVGTLTNRSIPVGDPGALDGAYPLQFHNRRALTEALRGAEVFVNTYWVRYPYVGVGFDTAVRNIGVLLEAARDAGVQRIVHVSVSNPSVDSPLGYYRGKAHAEALVRQLGLPYTIVRPTLVVGENDILVNNIAWFLRRLPVFGMPGAGDYRLQPVTLEDTGEIVADAALASGDATIDAAGPDIVTFEELVRAIAAAIGREPRIIHLPPALSLLFLRAAGQLVGEVILSREELAGLMSELLVSHEPPRGTHSVLDWLAAHGADAGRTYSSEFKRHVRLGR
jgi:NADH dehydrogenase